MAPQRPVFHHALLLCLLSGIAIASAAQPVVTTLTEPFSGSGGMTLHPTIGALYVADFGDALGSSDPSDWGPDVKEVSTDDGSFSVFANGFFIATGNDFASDGTTLLQVELGRGLVFQVSPSGNPVQWASGLVSPVGIAAAPDGGAFVAECGGNTIQRIAPRGTKVLYASDPEFNCPNGLTIGPDGVLYTVNFNDGKIFRIDTDGTVSLLATGPGGGNGHVAYAAGRLIVADRAGHQILGVGLDGTVEVIAGSGEAGNADGPASEATFRFPNGIAVTPDGSTIYVNSKFSDVEGELNPTLVRVISGVPVAGEEETPERDQQGLLPVAPNPSRGTATIRYTLASPASVELAVYSVTGKRVAVLEDALRGAGEHAVVWDGTDASGQLVAAGTYLCRLRTDAGQVESRLLTLVH